MYLSQAGESSRTQWTPARSTEATLCAVCGVSIQQKGMASSWMGVDETLHYVCVSCLEAGNTPIFNTGVHQRNLYERVHIAEQMLTVANCKNKLQSECARLAAIQQHMAHEIDKCNKKFANLATRNDILQFQIARDEQAQMYPHHRVVAHLDSAAGSRAQVARAALLDKVQRDGNVSTSDSLLPLTEMKKGLSALQQLVSAWATMSPDDVQEQGNDFGYKVKCLALKTMFNPGDKCLMYAKVFGITKNVFLTELVRKMFFSDFFANNVTSRFASDSKKPTGVPRTKHTTPVLLVQLQEKTSNMITNFLSNLFTVNVLPATSAGPFTHPQSVIICAVAIVQTCNKNYDSGSSHDGMSEDDDEEVDEITYTRISPHITNNVDDAPLLSFQVPKNMAFAMYLFNWSDADLCVRKGTVISNGDQQSVVAEGDWLLSHQYSSRQNQPDTNVPAHGVSLVVDMLEAQPAETQKYALKDTNNKIFLRVETSLATRPDR
jgi:hypothetical protein